MDDVVDLLELAHEVLLEALRLVLAPSVLTVLREDRVLEVNLLGQLLLNVVRSAQKSESLHLKMTGHLELASLLRLEARHDRPLAHLQHVRLRLVVLLVFDYLVQVLDQLFSVALGVAQVVFVG